MPTFSPCSSWRVHETAVAVRGGRLHLYRAEDRHGKPVASLLRNDRSMEAEEAFLRAAISWDGAPWPERINVDGNSAAHRGERTASPAALRCGFRRCLDRRPARFDGSERC
jgi:transposase-like protein